MFAVLYSTLIEFILDIKSAKAKDANNPQLALARDYQRKAQFRLDFVEAENSTGFHAPQEAARILADSINLVRKGQRILLERNKPKNRDSDGLDSRFPRE